MFENKHRSFRATGSTKSLRRVPVAITAQEAAAAGLGKVAKACIMEVVRPLRVVTLPSMRVAQAGLQPIMITVTLGGFAVAEDIPAIVIIVAVSGIPPPTRPVIEAGP